MTHFMSIFLPLICNCHDVITRASIKHTAIILGVLIIIILFAWKFIIPQLLKYENKTNAWQWISDHFKWCFLFVFGMGFILYYIGYYHNIEGSNFFSNICPDFQAVGRALLSSLSMFVIDTDLIEVGEVYRHNVFYLSLFAIVHILGVLLSTYFIIRLIGERFLSNRRMSGILANNKERDIYVFWGINEESITLAESIKSKYCEDKLEKRLELLFVETPSEKELEIKEHSISHFFNSSLHGSSEKDRIKAMKGTVLFPKRRLIEVEKNFSGKDSDIFKKLGLSDLYDLCNRSNNVRFFFLSDDEQKNIQDTLIIQDIFKQKAIDNKLNLYCKSRNDYANRAVVNASGLFVTQLIDDAALSIKSLKEKRLGGDYIAHPVNFVNPDPERGVALNPFCALIIGFGTAGQDALRFLYEYGVFVNSYGEESPFKCYIIDKEMDNIKGHFIREVPSMDTKNNPCSMKNIKFFNCDWNSESFKSVITTDLLNELSYVLVAAGSDKSNAAIVADLYEYVKKNKKNGLSKFRIFVRVYDKENEKQIRAISAFYKENDNQDVITTFGTQSEIYTYKNIIRDERKEKQAREFFETYLEVSDESEDSEEEKEKKRLEAWEIREREIVDVKTAYDRRLKLLHQREQDFSNVLHIYTKLKLCKFVDRELPDWKSFPFHPMLSKAADERNYLECLNNLAQLEHIRWNAAHIMAGFVYAEEKDFRKKTHPCLIPFQQLKDEIKRYDYATVITTIKLEQKLRSQI